MPQQTISTYTRYLYLNTYAFILFLGGIGILCLPFWKIHWIITVIQIVIFFICEKGAYGIFSSWEDKKRKYVLLVQRNSKEFRPDTFKEFMQSPCGRLLTKLVLQDLGQSKEYHNLKKLKLSFTEMIKHNCKSTKTTIRIYPVAGESVIKK